MDYGAAPPCFHSFRVVLFPLKWLGLFPNSFQNGVFTTTINDQRVSFLYFGIYLFSNFYAYYKLSKPIHLKDLTVIEYQHLALKLIIILTIFRAFSMNYVSYKSKNDLQLLFLKMSKIDEKLSEIGARINFQRFQNQSIVLVYGSFGYVVCFGIVQLLMIRFKYVEQSIGPDFILININGLFAYGTYLSFFGLLIYAIQIRFDKLNRILKKQLLQRAQLSKFRLVNGVGALHLEIMDLVEVVNENYASLISNAVSCGFGFLVYLLFQYAHTFKINESYFRAVTSTGWAIFHMAPVLVIFAVSSNLASSVSLLLELIVL